MNGTPCFEHSEADTLQSTFLQGAVVVTLGPGFMFFEHTFTPGPDFVLRKYRGNLFVLRNICAKSLFFWGMPPRHWGSVPEFSR